MGNHEHSRKALSGATELGPGGLSFAASRLKFSIPKPTADAVGHPLAAAPQLSTPAIKNGFADLIQQPGGLTTTLCAAILTAMQGRKIQLHVNRLLSNSIEFFPYKE